MLAPGTVFPYDNDGVWRWLVKCSLKKKEQTFLHLGKVVPFCRHKIHVRGFLIQEKHLLADLTILFSSSAASSELAESTKDRCGIAPCSRTHLHRQAAGVHAKTMQSGINLPSSAYMDNADTSNRTEERWSISTERWWNGADRYGPRNVCHGLNVKSRYSFHNNHTL